MLIQLLSSYIREYNFTLISFCSKILNILVENCIYLNTLIPLQVFTIPLPIVKYDLQRVLINRSIILFNVGQKFIPIDSTKVKV